MKLLAKPENAFVYLATDAQELASRFGKSLPLLQTLFNQSTAAEDQSRVMQRYDIKSEHEYRRGKAERVDDHVAFGVGGTESCFLKQSILYNNTDWTHKEVADIRVMLQYLSDRMYDEVRGQGLTYGVSMSASVTEGRLTISLTRSSRLTEAYRTVQEILRRYIERTRNGTKPWQTLPRGQLSTLGQ